MTGVQTCALPICFPVTIIFIGDAISMESSLFASSVNLVRAGKFATDKQDIESLIRIAKAWYDIARYLGGEDEEDKKQPGFGFVTLESELDDPGIEPDEDQGGTEISTKSRKLRNSRSRNRNRR